MFAIVPNELSHQIHMAIDKALDGRVIAAAERDVIYRKLLEYVDMYGFIPPFELKKNDEATP